MFGSEAFGASPWRSARPVPEVATAEVSAAVAAVQSSNRSIVVRQPRVHAQADGEEAGALLGAILFCGILMVNSPRLSRPSMCEKRLPWRALLVGRADRDGRISQATEPQKYL